MDIHQGDFWCLLGPNGEGKTTLLKAILGAIRPKGGKFTLRADFANRTRIGLVPQESEINTKVSTTVEELVLTGVVGLSLDVSTRTARLKNVLELMGLSLLRRRDFWTLSGGQRQRALVARALIRDPLLLIVDEPTAGLDWAAATGLLETISDLSRNKGITVLFVTHDLNIAAQRASHVAFIRQGRVIAGRLGETFNPENLKAAFGVPIELVRDRQGVCSVRVATPTQEGG